MKLNPFTIVCGLLGIAVKWVVLLAVVLFAHDVIKARKERKNV